MDAEITAQEAFATRTLDACQTHSEWLTAIERLIGAAHAIRVAILNKDIIINPHLGREDRQATRYKVEELTAALNGPLQETAP